MAAPGLVTRTLPTGFKMPDGYKTTIALGNKPGLQIWEKTVKPPAIDGGEAIPTTTMHNIAWRTFDTRHLKTLGPATTKCMLDPDAIADFIAQCNINQAITVKFPDLSTLTFWGFFQKGELNDFKEGENPEVDVTFTPTNWDPVNYVEAAPVFVAAAGT